ncbi:MAG: hypothetical protein ACK4NE_01280 [Albidovulum sp.]
MIERARIAALARLAGIRKDADLAEVAAADLHLRSVRARIDAFDTTVAETQAKAAASADPVSLAALEAFLRWSAQHRRDLAMNLESAANRSAQARRRAQMSFGRAEVLDRLAAGAAAAERSRH